MKQKRWPLLCGLILASVLPPAFGGLTNLYHFTDGIDGAVPEAGLTQASNGLFFGTAINGGTNGFGTTFSITSADAFTPLFSFTGGSDGAAPWSGLVQSTNGVLYGTTTSGGQGYGSIFSMTANGAVTPLYSFSGGNDGASPQGNLILAADGNFYGIANSGGTNGLGAIFRVTPGGTLTSLYSFTGLADGASPAAGLTLGTNGLLYGSTTSGGASGVGTLFKMTILGQFTLLYTFTSGADGASPQIPLVGARDGNFYGAASAGGVNNNGSLFRLSPAGQFASLYSFSAGNGTNSEGISPSGLVAASDGNLYGVTANGGANGSGTIFESTLSGTVTTLYTFAAISTDTFTNVDGSSPSGILQARDGNFYGTTTSGGPQALGTIFAFTGPAHLQFLAPDVAYTNGQAILRLSGIGSSHSIIVDASTNLTQWAAILTNPPASGQIQLTDAAAHNFPRRFYRARLGP